MITCSWNTILRLDMETLLLFFIMKSVIDLLFKNSQREKLLKRFLEYCYMIDVKVAFEGLKVVRNYKYYTLLTLFWLIDAVILIIDKAYISDKREMREGAD